MTGIVKVVIRVHLDLAEADFDPGRAPVQGGERAQSFEPKAK